MKWFLKYERSTCRLAARGIVEMSVAVDDLKSIRSTDCRRAGPCYIDRLDST